MKWKEREDELLGSMLEHALSDHYVKWTIYWQQNFNDNFNETLIRREISMF